MNCRPFHLALPTLKLEETEHFYCDVLGCDTGRRDVKWIDFDFFGHQVVFHDTGTPPAIAAENPVDGKQVPVPHLGVILTMKQFWKLVDQLQKKRIKFIIEPYIRFEGLPGEQATMFFYDPNGYALEFKAFKNDEMIFEK